MEVLLSSAARLQQRLSVHLVACASQSTSRRCYDPALELPSPSPISDHLRSCSASGDVARRISDLYMESVRCLKARTEEQYLGALDDLLNSHDYCHLDASSRGQVCPVSQGLHETFSLAFRRKDQALVAEAVRLVTEHKNRPLPIARNAHLPDHLPILEFAFAQCSHPTAQDRALLSLVTGRTERQISIWFQNRRARAKVTTSRREPPRTIEQLGELLREQQRFAALRQTDEASNDSDSGDSGYASGTPVASVDDLVRLLEEFHLSDNPTVHTTAPRRKKSGNATERRVSTSSDETTVGHPSPKISEGRSTSRPPATKKRPAAARATPRAPRPCQRASVPADSAAVGTPVSVAPPSCAVTEHCPSSAISYNRTRGQRKRAPLPTRRPQRTPSWASSSSSCPSLASTSASRVSSLSSESPDLPPSTPEPPANATGTDQLYYKDALTGEFVPVSSSSVVVALEPGANNATGPALQFEIPATMPVILGSPRLPQFAPDHDPRALSSNLLQSACPASSDWNSPASALFDVVGDSLHVHGADGGLSNPNVAAPPSPGHLGAVTQDLWPCSAALDVVNYAYDQSWATPAPNTTSWAHLLGVEI